MAVTMESATSTKSSSWTKIFKTDTILNQEQSLQFIRKFTAVGISSILYLRSSLPEDNFDLFPLDNIKVSMLVEKSPMTKEICKGVKNALKAIKPGYLRQLDLVFHPNGESKDVLESHSFRYDYMGDNNENVGSPNGDKEIDKEVKFATWKLYKKLSSYCQMFPELPSNATINIRLLYTDSTPDDYQPPGFTALSPRSLSLTFSGDPSSYDCGSVQTRYHKAQFRIK